MSSGSRNREFALAGGAALALCLLLVVIGSCMEQSIEDCSQSPSECTLFDDCCQCDDKEGCCKDCCECQNCLCEEVNGECPCCKCELLTFRVDLLSPTGQPVLTSLVRNKIPPEPRYEQGGGFLVTESGTLRAPPGWLIVVIPLDAPPAESTEDTDGVVTPDRELNLG